MPALTRAATPASTARTTRRSPTGPGNHSGRSERDGSDSQVDSARMPDNAVFDAVFDADRPHPVVSQLSALHRFRVHLDIAVVVVVLVLTNLIAHFTTPWASIATVPAAAVALAVLMRASGLDLTPLALVREHWKPGMGYAVAAVAVVASVITVGVLLPMTRPMF